MMKIEEYLIERIIFNRKKLKADDECISDGAILVNKDFLKNKQLKNYKNCDFNIIKRYKIPYEKGTEWELPDSVRPAPLDRLKLIYDKEYSYDYDLVKLFISLPYFDDIKFFISDYHGTPLLQIFNNRDVFDGVIMPRMEVRNK